MMPHCACRGWDSMSVSLGVMARLTPAPCTRARYQVASTGNSSARECVSSPTDCFGLQVSGVKSLEWLTGLYFMVRLFADGRERQAARFVYEYVRSEGDTLE
ncbi:MAG: hypothetical protein BMS9Abin10_0440 [Gammaproteobacteria bacterium]|nr:MAG: hypothetical protein BMS9Abin10_0440 [Gammaproteobacteria bacterium]